MFTSGTAPPPGVKLSCAALTAPVDVPVVVAAKSADGGRAEAHLLALHVRRGRRRRAGCRRPRTRSRSPAEPSQSANIAAKIAQPCRWLPTSRPNAYVSANGISRSATISTQVREAGRVLERVRRVRVRDPAAVRAQLLDRLLARDRRRGRSPAPRPRPSCASPARAATARHPGSRAAARRRARAGAARASSSGRGRPRSSRSSPAAAGRARGSSATATAIPTAAETKFCTVSPAIWVRWLIVDSPP